MKSFFHRLFSAFRRVEVAGDSRESWSRRDFLLKGVVKTEPGLEIAPFFSPIASKAEGFCVETLDVLSRPQLVYRSCFASLQFLMLWLLGLKMLITLALHPS